MAKLPFPICARASMSTYVRPFAWTTVVFPACPFTRRIWVCGGDCGDMIKGKARRIGAANHALKAFLCIGNLLQGHQVKSIAFGSGLERMWLDAWTFVRETRSTNSTYPRTRDVWFWRSFAGIYGG